MAKVIVDSDGCSHLRGEPNKSLCGVDFRDPVITTGELSCRDCAKVALTAIELSTKQERREWRKL